LGVYPASRYNSKQAVKLPAKAAGHELDLSGRWPAGLLIQQRRRNPYIHHPQIAGRSQ
jgi:hypothetical protein